MIFNLFKTRHDEANDTGTYADGAFELPVIDVAAMPRRLRGHVAHQRDYGRDRTVAQIPSAFA